MSSVIEKGICCCIEEPRGRSGLEGYLLGEEYYYEIVRVTADGRTHARVYPIHEGDYYETCGTLVFLRHFEKLSR